MAHESNWLRNRIACTAATLLAGTALAMGGMALGTPAAVADEPSGGSNVSVQNATFDVLISGSYATSASEALLAQVNSLRAAAGLPDLAWSSTFEAAAQAQAAAAAFDPSLTSVSVSGATSTIKATGTSTSLATLFSGWTNQEAAYQTDPSATSAADFAKLMAASATSIGIGCFTTDTGSTALVAVLGTDAGADDGTATVAPDGAGSATVDVPSSGLTVQASAPASLEIGATASLAYSLLYNGAPVRLAATPVWSSSDAAVLALDETGNAQALAAGTATASLSSNGDVLAASTVSVTAPTALSAVLPEGSSSLAVDCGGDPADIALPDTATVSWSNGTATEEPVAWDAIDASDCAVPDATFTINGTAAGLPVSATVTVGANRIVGVATPEAVETVRGTAANLPAELDATWADGSTSPVAAVWDDPEGGWDGAAASFDLPGHVEGWDADVLLHVTLTEPAASGDSANGIDPGAPNIEGDGAPDGSGQGDGASNDGQEDATSDSEQSNTGDDVAPMADPAFPEGTTIAELPTLYLLASLADGTETWTIPNVTAIATEPGGTVTELPIASDAWAIDDADDTGAATLSFPVTIGSEVQQIAQRVQLVRTQPANVALTPTAGDAVVLPDTVELAYDDTVVDAPVVWDSVPGEALNEDGTWKAGAVLTLEGTVPGDLARVTLSVEVHDAAPVIVGVANLDQFSTPAGVAPVLPQTVEVTYDDGTAGDADVAWDEIDPAQYATEGAEFTVEGTVAGTELKAHANVTVAKPVVTNVAAATAETIAGTAPALPQTVRATWSDGTETDAAVTWDAVDEKDYAVTGTFVVNGKIADDESVTATCTVTVKPAPVSVEPPAKVSTDAGTAPVLPTVVNVIYSDGSTQQHAVTWTPIDEASYHNGGSFVVSGTVSDVNLTTQVTVEVANAKVTGVQNNLAVQTSKGTAPKLPETASVRWSNGDVTNEKVTWSAIDANLYAQVGAFTVNGTAAGYTIPCKVTVVDQISKTGDEVGGVQTIAVIGGIAGLAIVAGAVALIARRAESRA